MVYQFMPYSGNSKPAQQWWASASPQQEAPQAPPVLPTPRAQSWTSGAEAASHLRARQNDVLSSVLRCTRAAGQLCVRLRLPRPEVLSH